MHGYSFHIGCLNVLVRSSVAHKISLLQVAQTDPTQRIDLNWQKCGSKKTYKPMSCHPDESSALCEALHKAECLSYRVKRKYLCRCFEASPSNSRVGILSLAILLRGVLANLHGPASLTRSRRISNLALHSSP